MLRRLCRKYLPSHEKVRSNRHIARFGPWLLFAYLNYAHKLEASYAPAAAADSEIKNQKWDYLRLLL